MELSYLISAVRKRWWIVVLGAVAAAALAYVATGNKVKQFQAQAVLLVAPSTSITGGGNAPDANRYLQDQLSVLRSNDLAEKVAGKVGSGVTRDYLTTNVLVQERPGNDVVDIFAKGTTGAQAAEIANTYVQTYLEDLSAQAKDSSQSDIDEIDGKLAGFNKQLGDLQATISQARKDYYAALLALDKNLTTFPQDFTPVEAALPKVNYDTILQQYTELVKIRYQLDATTRTKLASQVVQKATEPTVPLTTAKPLYIVAGGLAGAIMGLLAAVFIARLSQKLVDDQQAGIVLGQGMVGVLTRQNQLGAPLPELITSNAYDGLSVIDELCVRAESNARRTGFVTVVVVGTEQSAGATTIATAMAGQFARFGTQVLLVDADPRRSGITEGFKAFGDGGIPALLASTPDGSLTAGRRSNDSFRKNRSVITATSVPEVAVLGRGDKSGTSSLRRSDVETLLERALTIAPVVIIDAGAVLDAASTVELCRLADAVVLAVPTPRQKINQLEVVSRQLGRRQGELLPVGTRPRKHRDRREAPVTVDDTVVTAVSDAAEVR